MGFALLPQTDPFDIDSGIDSPTARGIATAVLRHAVALLARRHGRWEPLASAGVFLAGDLPLLVSCSHLFDAVAGLGDVGIALDAGEPLCLRSAQCRVLTDSRHDVLLVAIHGRAARRRLLDCADPLRFDRAFDDTGAGAIFVVGGFPYAQMRRVDGRVFARPAVFFARAQSAPAEVRMSYARTALRVDGAVIRAPALDGMSGAPIWAVRPEREARDSAGQMCHRVTLAGVQHAFRHDAYVRGTPIGVARALLRELRG
jgi:hypothetical protein